MLLHQLSLSRICMVCMVTSHEQMRSLCGLPSQAQHWEHLIGLTAYLCLQVGMFQVLLLQRTPQRAYSVLQPLEPFTPFRDPSMGSSLFDLTVFHCILVSMQQLPALHPAHTPCVCTADQRTIMTC